MASICACACFVPRQNLSNPFRDLLSLPAFRVHPNPYHCHHRRLFQHFRRFSASFHHRTHFPISLASDQKYERGGWSSSSSFGRSIISIRTKKNLKVTEIGLRRLEKEKAAVGCQAAADMIPGRTRPQRPIHQSTLICGTGLPLASNRWVRLSLSRLCPLF